ncbi:MAG: hypothetical protein AB7N76_02590 [Planctomycetota bacterium]
MKGPGYTTKDLFYWGGLIAGWGIGHQLGIKMGVTNRFALLGMGLALGVGLGWLLERIHSGPQSPDDF